MASPTAQPISIWQPEVRDGVTVFVRQAPTPLGDHYSDRLVIPARKPLDTQRVCFFGESVAAGYLYAPHVTPAKVLDHQLSAMTSTGDVEVIDLARTNETLDSLVVTVEQSTQLEPDTLVIFCGNNWNLLETPEVSPYHPAARSEYSAALRESGPSGPIELAAKRRLRSAGAALAAINNIARSIEAAVILVVPEVNIADWQSRQPVPWLPGGATNEWHRAYSSAVAALDAEQWDIALDRAGPMLDLDDGLNPSTCRILANAYAGLGDHGKAALAARQEVANDHAAAMCFLAAPRAAPIDQELLRRGGRHHGFTVVDLPSVFARHCDSNLPGRRMFLDYCHLSAEGMTVAMAAVTAAIVGTTTEAALSIPRQMVVSANVEATALLGAAIHTAHRQLAVDPSARIIEHWLRAALDAAPEVATAMLDVVEARVSRVPEVLTTAQQRNLDSNFRLGYQHGWRYDHLDIALIEAIGRVLAEHGRPLDETIHPLLLRHRAIGPNPTELVQPPVYLDEPLARFYPEVMPFADVTPKAFHRSPWPSTGLVFVSSGELPVRLRVTARLPAYPGAETRSGVMSLMVNGHRIDNLALSEQWSTSDMLIPQDATRAGINKLTLDWPQLPEVGERVLRDAAERLERGLAADIHPVFGELFSTCVWTGSAPTVGVAG